MRYAGSSPVCVGHKRRPIKERLILLNPFRFPSALPHVGLFDVAANTDHTSTFKDVTDDLGALEIEIMRGQICKQKLFTWINYCQ